MRVGEWDVMSLQMHLFCQSHCHMSYNVDTSLGLSYDHMTGTIIAIWNGGSVLDDECIKQLNINTQDNYKYIKMLITLLI